MLTTTNSLDIYDYIIKYPVLNENNYYTDNTNKVSSDLTIPLVPLINC